MTYCSVASHATCPLPKRVGSRWQARKGGTPVDPKEERKEFAIASRPKLKTRFIRFRASPEQEARWQLASSRSGRSFSDFARDLLDNASATGTDGRELATALFALRADLASHIGNNLNQIARHANTTGTVSVDALAGAMSDLAVMRGAIDNAILAVRPKETHRDNQG